MNRSPPAKCKHSTFHVRLFCWKTDKYICLLDLVKSATPNQLPKPLGCLLPQHGKLPPNVTGLGATLRPPHQKKNQRRPAAFSWHRIQPAKSGDLVQMMLVHLNNHYIRCIQGWLLRVPSQGYHHFPYDKWCGRWWFQPELDHFHRWRWKTKICLKLETTIWESFTFNFFRSCSGGGQSTFNMPGPISLVTLACWLSAI